MSKAWSFLWLVVAFCIAGVIIASLIEPYLGTIALIIAIVIVGFVGLKVYNGLSSRRRHF